MIGQSSTRKYDNNHVSNEDLIDKFDKLMRVRTKISFRITLALHKTSHVARGKASL